jgi:hypothetical protein
VSFVIAGIAYTGSLKPGGNLSRIEADQVTPFHEGDPSLGDEAADVTRRDSQVLGEDVDVDQVRQTCRIPAVFDHDAPPMLRSTF